MFASYVLLIAQSETAEGKSAGNSESGKDIVTTNTDNIWQTVDSMWDSFVGHLPQMIIGVVVFAGFCLLAGFAKRTIRMATEKRAKANLGQVLSRLAQWVIIFAGLLVATAIIAPSVKPVDLLAGLGIGGVAIGFAFKDILQNFLAGLLILIREPFLIGDEIKSGSYEGTVKSIETRATIIQTFDGKRVVIPNSKIYTNPVVVNTAHRQRRSEYEVTVGKLRKLNDLVDELHAVMANAAGVLEQPSPDVVVDRISDDQIHLVCRWWTEPQQQTMTDVKSEVIRRIDQVLKLNDSQQRPTSQVA